MIEHKQGDDGAKELQSKILAWQKWLTFFAAALIISYVSYFGLFLGQPRADDSDKWGAFGDFFGGILNPIVAFAAFYWLTQSVKLQRKELAETRAELRSAAEAQKELAENGKVSVRLAALTAVSNATHVDVTLALGVQEAILRDRPSDDVGRYAQERYDADNVLALTKVQARIRTGNEDLINYKKMMEEILLGSSDKRVP